MAIATAPASFASGSKRDSNEAGQTRSAATARSAESDASSTGDAPDSNAGRTAAKGEDARACDFESANRLFRNVCRERPSHCRGVAGR